MTSNNSQAATSADGSAPVEKAAGIRYAAIDGLRGISALWIGLSHFYTNLLPFENAKPWGTLLDFILNHRYLGYVGIYIFFVLSGFVIARNFYQMPMTLGVVGRFAMRRSIRLDPTYWTVIALTLALEALKSQYLIGTARSWGVEYSGVGLAANLFYLNDLLGFSPIVAAGWTLCLEIQFYLVFALLELANYRTNPHFGTRAIWSRWVWFLPIFIWSIVVYCLLPSEWAPTTAGLFIEYWYVFFLGVMAWWALADATSWKMLWVSLFLLLIVVVVKQAVFTDASATFYDYGRPAGTCAAMIAAAAIYLLGHFKRLETALGNPIIQYLGRISYSLYLIHPLAGNRVIRLFLNRIGGVQSLGTFEVIAVFTSAVILSVLAAHGLYVLIERPTHRLSRKISLVDKSPAS